MAARSDRPDERPDETPEDVPAPGTPAPDDGPATDGATGSAGEPDEGRAEALDGARRVARDEPVADEDWASIVARLGDVEAAAGAATAGGLDFPVAPGVDSPFDRPRVVRPAGDPLAAATGRDWDGTSQYDDAEGAVDEQEAFVPPDPGPVLGGDPLLTMAWFAAAGVPLLLLVVVVAWRDAPATLVQAACVVFVIGVAVLVWRMPQRRDHGDDDGAVV